MDAQPYSQKIENLYNQLEDFITDRSIYGRAGRDVSPEAAAHFRSVVNPEIARLRKELNSRGWPSRKPQWMIDAEQEAEDAADQADTRQSVLEAMV